MARAPTLIRHESELGRLELARRSPAAALRGSVAGYTGYREETAAPLRRREPAVAGAVLIVSFGPELRLSGADGTASFASFVAGPDDGPTLTEHDGRSHGVQVDLTPLGARMLLGVPMHDVARRAVPLDGLLGRAAAELEERLHDAPGWEARFALLDDALTARLAAARAPSPSVVWAWRRLVETDGRVAIGALAERLGCSRMHLSREFREHVGLAPKAAARVLRFRRALRLLEERGRLPLAELALACGYADQSHFNRDFRACSGATPTEHAARLLPDGLGAV